MVGRLSALDISVTLGYLFGNKVIVFNRSSLFESFSMQLLFVVTSGAEDGSCCVS